MEMVIVRRYTPQVARQKGIGQMLHENRPLHRLGRSGAIVPVLRGGNRQVAAHENDAQADHEHQEDMPEEPVHARHVEPQHGKI